MFIRLGFTAYGGPAAHIALFHDEAVNRRKWLSEREFLDLLGAVNLIPGPNSTEMAIHIGYVRAGLPGLIAGGAGFIVPAMFLVLALSWVYLRFGSTPEMGWLLYGVKPVIIAVVAQALYNLGKQAMRTWTAWAAALLAILLDILGAHPLAQLVIAGVLIMLIKNRARLRSLLDGRHPLSAPVLLGLGGSALSLATAPFSLPVLFFTFLKIGSVLYGSGYVLLAFLQADFVDRLGWLTSQQLLDAVAIGQLTPGPVFTTATFVGYILGGLPGALLATLGIFLPSFFFVALGSRFIPRLRSSPWAASLLDGVVAASLGLMITVTWQLGRSALIDLPTVLLAVLALVLLVRFKVNSTWLILGGAAAGYLLSSFS